LLFFITLLEANKYIITIIFLTFLHIFVISLNLLYIFVTVTNKLWQTYFKDCAFSRYSVSVNLDTSLKVRRNNLKRRTLGLYQCVNAIHPSGAKFLLFFLRGVQVLH